MTKLAQALAATKDADKKMSAPELELALAEALKDVDWRNPEQRYAVATDIVELIKTDVFDQDLVSMFADVRTFKQGEEIKFKTLEGLTAHVIEPGSFAPRSRLIAKETSLPKRLVTVAFPINIAELRSGRYGSILDARQKAEEQLLGMRNALVWNTMFGSITSATTDSNYATIASGDLAATKQAALDAALEHCDEFTQNGPAAIIGRFSALSWIEDLTSFSDTTKDVIMRDGFLGEYRGVPIIRMKSFRNSRFQELINSSNILIIGRDTTKFGIVDPGLEVEEQYHGTTTRDWEIALWEEYGVAVVNSMRNYRIEIVG